jgi:hypothetical protein
LQQRVEQVEEGRYETMLRDLMQMDKDKIKELYMKRQAEPDNADEMWEPTDKTHL